jgi:hypothetical protein
MQAGRQADRLFLMFQMKNTGAFLAEGPRDSASDSDLASLHRWGFRFAVVHYLSTLSYFITPAALQVSGGLYYEHADCTLGSSSLVFVSVTFYRLLGLLGRTFHSFGYQVLFYGYGFPVRKLSRSIMAKYNLGVNGCSLLVSMVALPPLAISTLLLEPEDRDIGTPWVLACVLVWFLFYAFGFISASIMGCVMIAAAKSAENPREARISGSIMLPTFFILAYNVLYMPEEPTLLSQLKGAGLCSYGAFSSYMVCLRGSRPRVWVKSTDDATKAAFSA